MTSLRAFFAVACLLAGCGRSDPLTARSGSPVDASPPTADAGIAKSDAGPPPDCIEPTPAPSRACEKTILAAPAGSLAWSLDLDTGTADLLGPLAADSSGNTYFVAADQGLYPTKIYSIDPCGERRWQVDATAFPHSGYLAQAMVVGDRLIFIGIGTVVAFNLSDGLHRWTADVAGFVEGGGLGVPGGKVMGLGETVAAHDGTLFTMIANDYTAWIVAVDAQRKMAPVASWPNYVSALGYELDSQKLALDSLGRLALVGRATAADPSQGEQLRVFTRDGRLALTAALPSWGYSTRLAAGPDYVTGAGGWMIGRDGKLRNQWPGGGATWISWDGPTAIDAGGAMVVGGGQQLTPGVSTVTSNLLRRFAPDGSKLWEITLPDQHMSGPVLGNSGQVFILTSPYEQTGTVRAIAYSLTDGAKLWQAEFARAGKVPSYWLSLTPSGALVFRIDKQILALASGGQTPPACAWWPGPSGGADQRVAPRGQ